MVVNSMGLIKRLRKFRSCEPMHGTVPPSDIYPLLPPYGWRGLELALANDH